MLDISTLTLLDEKDIIGSWADESKKIVSVVCATFNHGPYIEDAIKSFLMQKTDFAYEIIIHDDCSTDSTVEVIKRYHLRYPNIIKPIFQSENQFSKGGFKPSTHAAGFASGEYIALCEGDDYWCDPYKLQKQKETLDSSELNMCFTAGYYKSGAKLTGSHQYFNTEEIVPLKEVILKGGGYIITASLFLRASVFEMLPKWFYQTAPVGDVFIQIFGSLAGGAIFLPSKSVVYRRFVDDSWSSRQSTVLGYIELKRLKDFELCFNSLLDYGVSSSDINEAISREYFISSLKFLSRDFLFGRYLLLHSRKISSRKYLLRELYYWSFNESLFLLFEKTRELYRKFKLLKAI